MDELLHQVVSALGIATLLHIIDNAMLTWCASLHIHHQPTNAIRNVQFVACPQHRGFCC